MIIEKLGRIPIKSWCNLPEVGAMEQARNLANLPFAFHHVALMPDTHQGYGMPIGGVLATEDVIIPNAVGVDIGCGMLSVKTSLTDISVSALERIVDEIYKQIPVGFNHHQIPCDETEMPYKWRKVGTTDAETYPVVHQEFERARFQLGTLGGGNHFIEIQRGSDGHIWFMIHSGSRNLGFKVAEKYSLLAGIMNNRWFSSVPKEWELAFLPSDSKHGKTYLTEMNYCLEFAYRNRKAMANRIKDIIEYNLPFTTFDTEVNIHHNYVALENHFGSDVWVHRKGATSAKSGEMGIIPGSQGTSSYIVQGLGNVNSFMSCSHGAGRAMGRKEAKRVLSLEDELGIMNRQGIVHRLTEKNLDEAPSAYKNIDVVMEEQKDLVEIIIKLEPLAVIKG